MKATTATLIGYAAVVLLVLWQAHEGSEAALWIVNWLAEAW